MNMSIRDTAALMKIIFTDCEERFWFPLIFLTDHYPQAYRGLCKELRKLHKIDTERA